MLSSALEATNKMTTQTERLWTDALNLAQNMGHEFVDPSHLVVAALLSHDEEKSIFPYATASFPLIHPVRKGQDGQWHAAEGEGLELNADQAVQLVATAYPVLTGEPPVLQRFTQATNRMLERAYAMAKAEFDASNKSYGKPEITVLHLTWAAIESGSEVVNRLVPDEQRALHVFFRGRTL